MSFEHGTTYYGLPLTQNSDTRDWFDTNEPFETIDAAIHSAVETAGSATGDIEIIKNDLHGDGGVDERLTTVEGKVSVIEGDVAIINAQVTNLSAELADVSQDAQDMITAYNEESATSTHAYEKDKAYFIYNNVLYKATENIAIGDTIVPNVNCKATNVTTEILAIETGGGGDTPVAADVDYDNTTSGLTATNVQAAIDEIVTGQGGGIEASAVSFDDTTAQLSAANVQAAIEALKTLIDNLPQGGGNMKCVKYGTGTGQQTIDISDLGLTSAEDYFVLLNGTYEYNATTGAGLLPYISAKTATSFTVTGVTLGGVTSEPWSYQVLANV